MRFSARTASAYAAARLLRELRRCLDVVSSRVPRNYAGSRSSVVSDGLIFNEPVHVIRGEIVMRDDRFA